MTAPHVPGPWAVSTVLDGACNRRVYGRGDLEIIEANGRSSHGLICTLFAENHGGPFPMGAVDAANARLIAAAPEMLEALLAWKCPSCGGKGTYQQDASGRARKEAQGKPVDPRYQPDPVPCKICDGHGLHPTARAAITKARG